MLDIEEGDLCEMKVQYIAQQCNATHNKNFGLSSVLSKKFPHANIYSGKLAVKERKPGTIIVRGDEYKQKVIAMIAQINQGKPTPKETKTMREEFFRKCLEEIGLIEGIKEIAFPYGIGCGLAGGEWNKYFKMISEFSEKFPEINVKIVRLAKEV